MLTDKEKAFIEYWELRRIPYSDPTSKLLRGLPVAFLFGLPILLSVMLVYFFSPEWYTKVSLSAGSLLAIIVAVFIAILFFSFFRMHFKWEMNEQAYRELIKKNKDAAEKS